MEGIVSGPSRQATVSVSTRAPEDGLDDEVPTAFPSEDYERLRADVQADRRVETSASPQVFPDESAISESDHAPSHQTPLSHPHPPSYDDLPPPSYEHPPASALASVESDNTLPTDKKHPGTEFESTSPCTTIAESGPGGDEKRRIALDDVTAAIDKAYAASPSLDNQRSVLRPASRPLQVASTSTSQPTHEQDAGQQESSSGGAESGPGLRDEAELVKIMDQIERSHGHRYGDQTYVVDNTKRDKDLIKRESFYADLIHHGDSGRLENQDYPNPPQSPGDLLRLTEFIHDSPPASGTAP